MTFRPGRLAGLIVCIATMAAPAMAQDDPRFALVGSLPSPTVSLQWEVSEKFALRFEGDYRYRNESTQTLESSFGGDLEHVYTSGVSTQVIFVAVSADSLSLSKTHSGSFGVAGIFTLYRTDRLRLYAAPRLSVPGRGRNSQPRSRQYRHYRALFEALQSPRL